MMLRQICSKNVSKTWPCSSNSKFNEVYNINVMKSHKKHDKVILTVRYLNIRALVSSGSILYFTEACNLKATEVTDNINGIHRQQCLLVNKFSVQQSTFWPRPVHLSGTCRKYLSMASKNRLLYTSGDTTVGILPRNKKKETIVEIINKTTTDVSIFVEAWNNQAYQVCQLTNVSVK